MQSESVFTATSGARCQYEVLIEDGKASANIVWLGTKPTARDMDELARFLEAQADEANFPHAGPEHFLLGEIQKEDLPRAAEIVEERRKRFETE